MDALTKARRSLNMAAIRSKDTAPERIVRSCLHLMGLRFRLHRRGLPGKPDVVLPRHRAVVFVHGCFWHSHDCVDGHLPKSRRAYWGPKLRGNQVRDKANMALLRDAGWRVLMVWECETAARRRPALRARLARFFATGDARNVIEGESPGEQTGGRRRRAKPALNRPQALSD
ncbi:MAG: very short patch repair endonuclease [Myxococcaceae bacterium]